MKSEHLLTESELLRLAGFVENWYEMPEKHFQFAGKVVSLKDAETFCFSLGILSVNGYRCAHLVLYVFDGNRRHFVMDALSGEVWHLYRRVRHSLAGDDGAYAAEAASGAVELLHKLEEIPAEAFSLPDYPF